MDEAFACVRCGRCCEWEGDVRITPEEAEIIATFLRIPFSDFMQKYVRLAHDRKSLSLIEQDLTKHCIFYTQNPPACLIQSVKPLHCRQFPYTWNFPGWQDLCAGAK